LQTERPKPTVCLNQRFHSSFATPFESLIPTSLRTAEKPNQMSLESVHATQKVTELLESWKLSYQYHVSVTRTTPELLILEVIFSKPTAAHPVPKHTARVDFFVHFVGDQVTTIQYALEYNLQRHAVEDGSSITDVVLDWILQTKAQVQKD
jgi:hypothetical protein